MIRPAALAAMIAVAAFAGPALAQPDGQEQYELQCKFCHDDDTIAPPLTGVADRKIASTPFAYSDALKAKTGTWTDAELDAFLKAPSSYAPGTKMTLAVPSDENRAAIIAYLKTLK
jgi:cytochrome c2